MLFKGIIPPVITPFHQDGAIDKDGFAAMLEHLIASGVHGIILGGTTGEYYAQSRDERVGLLKLAKTVVKGKVPLIAGVGAIRTEDCIEYALVAKDLKYDGVLIGAPYYAVPTQLELANHALAIDKAVNLPIMLYNNPIAYGVDVTVDVLRELADTPEIVCVKEESGDIRRVTDIRIAHGDRFSVFCGVDDLIVESSALGVTGWVSGMANVWPAECTELFGLCAQNRYPEARALYGILTPSFHLDTHVKLVQYIKLAEHLVYGAPEWTRPPRLPLAGEEREFVVSTVRQAIKALEGRAKR